MSKVIEVNNARVCCSMWLKRKRVVVLASVFVITWLVIILYTPSPSGTNKQNSSNQLEHTANLKFSKTGNRQKPPKIKIVDVDENAPKDKEEEKIELQLRDAKQEFHERRDLPPSPVKVPDTQDEDSKNLWDIEMDIVPHDLPGDVRTLSAVWALAASWVDSNQITPQENPDLGAVLKAMATRRITKADIGYKGTQLKARLELSGGQWVVFKPGRYPRDYIVEGTPYAGYDRHTGEITAFHLDRVLGFHRAPIVVGRRVNLRTDIMPVASKELLNTFMSQENRTCFYGKCLYCKPEDPACADENDIMEGSLTLWLPKSKKLKKWHHIWSRTYRENKKAQWEYDNDFCKKVQQRFPLAEHRRVIDMFDTAAFDYLIGNADRHQYETFEEDGDRGMLLLMDSAKSFGNPHQDEKSILAPLYQCCKIRKSTWDKLLSFQDGRLSNVMRRVLSHDPLAPILTEPHLQAMDRRLVTVIATIEGCIKAHGEDDVLIS